MLHFLIFYYMRYYSKTLIVSIDSGLQQRDGVLFIFTIKVIYSIIRDLTGNCTEGSD
jgi:hypothetical protein